MPLTTPERISDGYDVIVVGTGFGSMFFLHGLLQKRPNARVLLVEWGEYNDHAWQLANRKNTLYEAKDTYVARPGEKPWNYTIGYGGGSNCWWAETPRLAPQDFRMQSLYGVSFDWPISYDDLEPYYMAAEHVMHISGPDDMAAHYPRSGPYPQPPHNLSSVDKIVKAAMPDQHFAVPCARLRIPVGNRGSCCGTFQCDLCPVSAKFTVLNTFSPLLDRPNVDLIVGSRVMAVETAAGRATGVRFVSGGVERLARGELIALGANGIQTPFMLLRSGFTDPALGRYLHEKQVIQYEALLDGVDNFDGGIPTSGCNVALHDGEFRREAAAAFIYFLNDWRDGLRLEWGRWRQTLPIEIFIEDVPQEQNGVFDEGGEYPVIRHASRSDYCARGVERATAMLPEVLASLPVEDVIRRDDVHTGSHVQGTCRMGTDPATSVVDANQVCHSVRNLMVLGTAVFPSCGVNNPSLTAAALSLRAADRLGA
jgi:choline dehydrogenase-like flavoprotein